jgi:ribosomal protein S18 acetylase RimI-like enzyme
MVADLDDPALHRAIETNLTGFFAGKLALLPGAQADVQREYTSFKTGHQSLWLNGIVPHDFTSGDVNVALLDCLKSFTDQQLPHFWMVPPSTLPKGLGERLKEAGLMQLDNMPGMAVCVLDLPLDQPLPEGIRTFRVEDDETLEQWSRAFGAGYEIPLDVTRMFAEASKLSGALTPGGDLSLYLAMAGDQPVGTSAVHFADGVAGIYCVAADPALRRRGIGSAITLAALKEASDRGYLVAILHASAAGEPIYLKMGFREINRFLMYGWFPG